MGANSKIEWTDDTDNPIVVEGGGWYCIKVSEGCKNCYAESLNHNGLYGGNGLDYKHLISGPPKLHLKREMLAGWAKKTKPKKHFVASMTDILGEFIPDEWVFEIWDAQLAAPLQTFLDLTKRAERLYQLATRWLEMRGLSSMPPNIWPMVSVENQERADERIPWLLKVPALVRGLSVEPLLGPVSIREFLYESEIPVPWQSYGKAHWVIVGGESGSGARPMHPNWARSLRDECQEAGASFFFKQWGSWIPKTETHQWDDEEGWIPKSGWGDALRTYWTSKNGKWGCLDINGKYSDGTTTWNGRQNDPRDDHEVTVYEVGKKAAGRILDGRTWDEFPALKEVAQC